MASRTRGKSRRKRPSAKGKKRKVGQVTRKDCDLVEVHARLDDLAHAMVEIHQVLRATRVIAARPTREAVDAQTSRIRFRKTSGPEDVRITLLDTNEIVLDTGDTDELSDPRPVGAEIDALIEVKGNPGEVAVIEVSSAIPRTIQLSARPGGTGNAATKPMLVV